VERVDLNAPGTPVRVGSADGARQRVEVNAFHPFQPGINPEEVTAGLRS